MGIFSHEGDRNATINLITYNARHLGQAWGAEKMLLIFELFAFSYVLLISSIII